MPCRGIQGVVIESAERRKSSERDPRAKGARHSVHALDGANVLVCSWVSIAGGAQLAIGSRFECQDVPSLGGANGVWAKRGVTLVNGNDSCNYVLVEYFPRTKTNNWVP
jgi:hypothetical protein